MTIINTYKGKKTPEGSGVTVTRVFGFYQKNELDPFLMLDLFQLDGTKKAGFDWHPHKGFETITYMLDGTFKHEDNLGNKGELKPGELQWMTAGKGIYHKEMPGKEKVIRGFQFWVNLPKKQKLIPPNYTYIKTGEMPSFNKNGQLVRVISGHFNDIEGPIQKNMLGINIYHISLDKDKEISLVRQDDKNGFVYFYQGHGKLNDTTTDDNTAYKLTPGEITIKANEHLEFIFAEGRPINEPVAWYGPIVMNTQKELEETFKDIKNETFGS
ncbi:MAG: pirin family protein [Candidatus Izimaplasma sp.]|nr:pirin family protein [Candidatus Izimaplasma bacterium]